MNTAFSKRDLPQPSTIKDPGFAPRKLISDMRQLLRGMSLERRELALWADLDLDGLAHRFLEGDIEFCRKEIHGLGGRLARRKTEFHTAVEALEVMLDVYLSSLPDKGGKRARPTLTVLRVYSQSVRTLAEGYWKEYMEEQRALIAELEERKRSSQHAAAFLSRTYERERRRLSENLHGQINSELIALKVQLEETEQALLEGRTQDSMLDLKKAHSRVAETLRLTRCMILDLGSATLQELGLFPAAKLLCREFSAKTGVNVTIKARDLPQEIPLDVQVALYRTLQGVLNHSGRTGTGNIKVSFSSTSASELVLTIEENGTGYFLSSVPARHKRVLGVLQERLEAVSGVLRVQVRPIDEIDTHGGTILEARVPFRSSE